VLVVPAAADPKLREFLALMAPRMKAKIWANDELLPNGEAKAGPGVGFAAHTKAAGGAKAGAGAAAAARALGGGKKGLAAAVADSEGDSGDGEDDGDYQDWTARGRRGARSGDGPRPLDEDEEDGGLAAAADPLLTSEAVDDLAYLRCAGLSCCACLAPVRLS
jgi:multiple RNA-binding domain-containing protein 1